MLKKYSRTKQHVNLDIPYFALNGIKLMQITQRVGKQL